MKHVKEATGLSKNFKHGFVAKVCKSASGMMFTGQTGAKQRRLVITHGIILGKKTKNGSCQPRRWRCKGFASAGCGHTESSMNSEILR